jgi:hypothetical protein
VHSQAFSALYPTTKGGAKSKRCGDFLEEFATRCTWHVTIQFVIQIADNNKELLSLLSISSREYSKPGRLERKTH